MRAKNKNLTYCHISTLTIVYLYDVVLFLPSLPDPPDAIVRTNSDHLGLKPVVRQMDCVVLMYSIIVS